MTLMKRSNHTEDPINLIYVMLCPKPKAYGQSEEPSLTAGLLAGPGVTFLKSD